MAIFSVLIGVGFAAAVGAVKEAEKNPANGWRAIWAVIGWVLLIGVLPVSWLLVRDPGTKWTANAPAIESAGDFTFADALRSPAFWAVALACSLFNFISSGMALFYEGVLRSFGFGRPDYEKMLSVMFLFGILFNLLCGWLARWWSLNRLLAAGTLVLAGSLAALPFARTMTQLYWYAAAMACAGGVVTVVFFIVWPRMFGAGMWVRFKGRPNY